MKKYIYKIFALLVAFTLMQSCETDNKVVDYIFDNIERGAVLRTIETQSATFDFNNTSSQWGITIEEQDIENGKLLAEVKVYSTFVNDGVSGAEQLVKTITASSFTEGPFGLPRADIAVSLQEALDKAGLKKGDYDVADTFYIRLELVLTNGSIFSDTNLSGTVAGSSFYVSPFGYSVQFFCALNDASIFNGTYVIDVDDWADYAPGDLIQVQYVSGFKFRILSTDNPFIDNPGGAYMEVTVNPDDASIVLTTPVCFIYGGEEVCFTGTGSVGSCTGTIDLVITYGGYGKGAFKIHKQ